LPDDDKQFLEGLTGYGTVIDGYQILVKDTLDEERKKRITPTEKKNETKQNLFIFFIESLSHFSFRSV